MYNRSFTMILTLVNLPFTVNYNDIKSLVQLRCGIQEIILDNMMPHENRTKKVTVGLADSEDAAIFMDKIDGYFWNGKRLQVIQKAKNQSSSNSNQQLYSGSTNSMQNSRPQVLSSVPNYRPHGSNSGQKYRPEGGQATSSPKNYRPQGSTSDQSYRPRGSTSNQSYRPLGSTSDQSYRSQGSTSDQSYRPLESTSDQIYTPQGSTSNQSYRPLESTSDQSYRSRGSTSMQSYRPLESTSDQIYTPQGSTSNQSYRPLESTSDQSYRSRGSTSMQSYRPQGSTSDQSYRPLESTSNQSYRPQGSTSDQSYRPLESTSDQSYRQRASTSKQSYRPQGSTSDHSSRPQTSSSGQESKSVQDYRPQESSWAAQSFDSASSNMMIESNPAMVPAPTGFEVYNYQASFNQSAYYLMNQPAYTNQTSSAPQNMAYQYPGISYGNMGVWNQQQQSSGFEESARQGKKSRWNIDCDSALDSNPGSDRCSDNIQPAWDDNQGSERADYLESKRENDRDLRDRNDRNSRGNYHDSRERHGYDSRERNDRDSRGRNDRDDSTCGNSSRRDSNRDSKWNSGHNSNRDSYRPDQAGPLHNRDSFNRSEPKYTQPAAYDDHVSGFSRKRGEISKSGPRDDRRTDRKPAPPAKRSRVSDFRDREPPQKKTDLENKKEFQFKKPLTDPKIKQSPNKEHSQVPTGPNATTLKEKAHLLRLQLCTELAKEILNDKRFEWEAPDRGKLKTQLKVAIRRRIDIMLRDDYSIKMKYMVEKYKIKFNTHNLYSHYLLFRRILEECGGKMITKMTPPARKPPRTRPQKAEKVAPGVFGNLKVDNRFKPPGEKQVSLDAKQIPPSVQTQFGKTLYPRSRIPKTKTPTFPEGDRNLQMNQRKIPRSLLNDDYVRKLLEAAEPAIAKAINEEIDALVPVIQGGFEETTPISIQFAEMGRSYTGNTMKKLLKINIARRIMRVQPIVVRIYASPMVKRPPLEQFLNKYNVSTLKRSVKKPYYVAGLDTVEDHDKLCALHSTTIAGCQVSFKPFHFAGSKDKITDTDIKRQRRAFKREQLRHSELAIKHYNIENGFKQIEPEDDYMDKDGDSEYEDDLQEIQETCDEINDNEQDFTSDIGAEEEEEEDKINTTEDPEMKRNDDDGSCEEVKVHISSVDLTKDEDDIDKMIDSLNKDLDCLPAVEDGSDEVSAVNNDNADDNVAEVHHENSDDINIADDINIVDLNDDDLEDW